MADQDPRGSPSYDLNEAARYLSVSKPVVRLWRTGRSRLSFFELVDVHLLDGKRRHAVEDHLKRIVWDEEGMPSVFFPFTRKRQPNDPKTIAIDPRVAFGRTVVAGTGIATAVVAERFKVGESIRDLAKDYGLEYSLVEEAIRWESRVA